MLMARNIRDMRPAASGDQNALGAIGLAIDLHPMLVEQARMALEQAHAAAHQQFAIDTVEALDLAVLVGNQRRPAETGLAGRPAKALGMLELVGELGAVDQQLFRHAPDVDAGTA